MVGTKSLNVVQEVAITSCYATSHLYRQRHCSYKEVGDDK